MQFKIILDNDDAPKPFNGFAHSNDYGAREPKVSITEVILRSISQQLTCDLPSRPNCIILASIAWSIAVHDDRTPLETITAHQAFDRPAQVIRAAENENDDWGMPIFNKH
jgi:hypothetical protein